MMSSFMAGTPGSDERVLSHYTAAVERRPSAGNSRRGIGDRIGQPCLGEALAPQLATVAAAARPPLVVRRIATARQGVIDAQLDPFLDDLRLGQGDQRRMNVEVAFALHAR